LTKIRYSKKEARDLKKRLADECSKVEEAAAALREVVPDADPDRYSLQGGLDSVVKDFRHISSGLGELIDRRTR
jgi:hypothetical protein